MTADPLGQRRVRQEILEEVSSDIDAFIEGEVPGERRWEVFELTQSHDVHRWIAEPGRIKSLQPQLAELARELGSVKGPCRILDVGCYGGYVLDYLVASDTWRDGMEYLGIDVQPAVVEAAARAHVQMGAARFEAGDVFGLSEWEPRSQDYVWCSRVLIHLPRFEEAVANLLHVARRRLFLVIKLGEEDSCRRIRETDLDSGESVVYYFRTISERTVAMAAGDAEFRIVRGDPYSLVVFVPDPAS